jgi:hypothetical protein
MVLARRHERAAAIIDELDKINARLPRAAGKGHWGE